MIPTRLTVGDGPAGKPRASGDNPILTCVVEQSRA